MLLPLCLFSNSNTHSKPYQYIICIFFPNKLYQSLYIVSKLKNKQVQQLKIIFASLPFAFFIELRGIAYKKSRQSRRRDFFFSKANALRYKVLCQAFFQVVPQRNAVGVSRFLAKPKTLTGCRKEVRSA